MKLILAVLLINFVTVFCQDKDDGCVCITLYAPVCGTDGKTYSNSCVLGCAQRKNPDLKEQYKSECKLQKDEASHQCICTEDYTPVCGTDGRTYSNACGLECEQRYNPNLQIKYKGECK